MPSLGGTFIIDCCHAASGTNRIVVLQAVKSSATTTGEPSRRPTRAPSPTRQAFLSNHAPQVAAVDFFTVPIATFRVLFCSIVLSHDRRRIIHFNVTEHPTAEWTAQQIVEAFPYDMVPRYILRDRDSIYGEYFRRRVRSMGIEEVTTA